jgi:metal-responsive CopG/Arc/MetJ family transcriptional regulator
MSHNDIAISIDRGLLRQLDRFVAEQKLGSRNQAIRLALQEMLSRWRHDRLATECARLDPAVERAMAEEGMSAELSAWPEY